MPWPGRFGSYDRGWYRLKYVSFLRVVHQAKSHAEANELLALIEKRVRVKKGVRNARFVAGRPLRTSHRWRIAILAPTGKHSGAQEGVISSGVEVS